MSDSRAMAQGVRLPSGKWLVAGGMGGSSIILSTAESYDPVTNTWAPAASMATPRWKHGMALLQNGMALSVGGSSGATSLASAELYDPTTNTWFAAAPMTAARNNALATALPSGKVLATGGGITPEVYDPALDAWSPTGLMASNRQRHTATLLRNGTVLVAGGEMNGLPLASAEIYDPSTNTWTAAQPMTSPRRNHTATLLPSGKVLVAGGLNDIAAAEIYDPSINSWSYAGTMSTARGYHSAELVQGKVLVAGGQTESNASWQATVELYDPATNAWSSAPPLSLPRLWHLSAVLDNGKVCVAGGRSVKNVELYSPTDIDLGSTLGNAVAQPSSCGASNAFTPGCAPSLAPEVSFSWVAPTSGTFTFTTTGSGFDTILEVLDGKTGSSLACNDDANARLQSSLTLDLVGKQRVTLVVDGHGSTCGPITLNISGLGGSTSQPGLGLWLRADTGIVLDPVDGKVSQWQDQSGNARNGVMNTSARRPRIVPSALNGKPVVSFDGAQSFYLSAPVQPSAFTVLVVGKNRKTTESFSMILGPGGNSPNNQLRWENGTQALFVGIGNNLPIMYSTIGNTRVYHLLTARYNGTAMSVYRDGKLASSHSFTTTGPWTLAQVGGWFSTYFMTGDLAEVLVYEQALSDDHRLSAEAYLKKKYALP